MSCLALLPKTTARMEPSPPNQTSERTRAAMANPLVLTGGWSGLSPVIAASLLSRRLCVRVLTPSRLEIPQNGQPPPVIRRRRRQIELGKDVGHVLLHRPFGDHQGGGYSRVAAAFG